ncbi:MAG: right-handed parallel beta-helix repeat-containing protein [Thermoplasmata archaeon]|nr:MAG: right-handed parallel beta-helix repeat-containing protein [Thermoplasmata archaeon]
MGRKVIAIWLSLIMMVSVVVIVDVTVDFTLKVGGATLYVNTTGSGGAYTSIQSAINVADPSDTVYVYNGIYYENLVIDTTINLTGEDRNHTFIDGNDSGSVIRINAHWVNLTGFTVKNGDKGIDLYYTKNNTVTDNNVRANFDGISLDSSSHNNTIMNNEVIFNRNGIYLHSSKYNVIMDNNASSNTRGMLITGSSYYNFVINNTIMLNRWYGIFIEARDNNISNNFFSLNEWEGLSIQTYSINITNNIFINDGIRIQGNFPAYYTTHYIPTNNLVNGNPVYYYMDSNNLNFDGIQVGQIILANCANIEIKNLTINYTDPAIQLAYSSYANITGNNLTDNRDGIFLYESSNNYISDNFISSNQRYGLQLTRSSNNIIIDNNVSYNDESIFLSSSSTGATFSGNLVHANTYGINLESSDDALFINNTVYNNDYGIRLWYSDNSVLKNNSVYSNNIYGISINKSSNPLVNENYISGNGYGLFLILSSTAVICNNSIRDNGYGISIESYSDVNITGNTIFSSQSYGVWLSSSNNDIYIHHNNFMNLPGKQASDNSANYWDDGYPSGGNYWSDFRGYDKFSGPNQNIPGNDGIGDTPYELDIDSQDNYPLMQPIGNISYLWEGWNLISIPLTQDEQELISVLDSIDSWYDAVQWYNSTNVDDLWMHHKVGKLFGNNLFKLNETMGFWIHITESDGVILEYSGTQSTSNQTIYLYEGWNIVGYPSLTSYNRSDGLNNLTFGQDVDLIQWYNASTKTWHDLDENDYFVPGRGYWVHAQAECEWEVPL